MTDSTLDSLNKSLDLVKVLRGNMTGFFQQISAGFRVEGTESETPEEREKATKAQLVSEIQKLKDAFT